MKQIIGSKTLFVRLTVMITAIVMGIMISHALITYFEKKKLIHSQMQSQSHQMIVALQDNLKGFIESYSIYEYEKILSNAIEHSDIFAIVLEDYNMGEIVGKKAYVVGRVRNQKWESIEYQSQIDQKKIESCYYKTSQMIHSSQGKTIGKITICFSDKRIQEELDNTLKFIYINAGSNALLLIFFLFFAISYLIIRPIRDIIQALEDRDQEGLPNHLVPTYSTHELETLATTINKMILSIQESHIKLKAIIRNVPDLFWIKDTKGIYLSCNKRFEDFFGAKESEIIGKSDYDFIDQELANFFREHDQAAMQANTPISNFEHVTYASDGHEEYLHTTKTKILDNTGNIYGILGIGRDMSEIHAYQEEIEQQKRELQTIFDTTRDGIVLIDFDTHFIFANQAYLKMTGFSREELLQKRCIEMSLEQDHQNFLMTLEKVKEQGFVENFEKDYRIKEKKLIKVNMTIALMPDKKRFLISTRDVTLMRQKEKLVKDYITIVDENIITSSTDLEGNITYISTKFCQVSGYSKDELIGKTHHLIRGHESNEKLYQELWQKIESNQQWIGEFQNKKKDGSSYWVKSTISPIFDINNQKIGYMAVSQDITDKKYMQMLSITDGLTNLYNRRYFNELLPKVLKRAKRRNELVCFVIMDIDFFKQYNDTYGHQKGDEALIKVSRLFKESLQRVDDYAFRLGGEEFGLILNSEDKASTIRFVKRIKEAIEALHIPHTASSVSPYLTVSIGLVCEPAKNIKNEKVIHKQADDLLYQAKTGGRNRICSN